MNVNAKRDNSRIKEIEIMDCTLRDGEQTNGVSFLPHEKLMIARMLLHDINVDRIEVASARVSEGEKDAVARICRYAKTIGKLDSVEVLGFVDNNKSVDWIAANTDIEKTHCRFIISEIVVHSYTVIKRSFIPVCKVQSLGSIIGMSYTDFPYWKKTIMQIQFCRYFIIAITLSE